MNFHIETNRRCVAVQNNKNEQTGKNCQQQARTASCEKIATRRQMQLLDRSHFLSLLATARCGGLANSQTAKTIMLF